MTTTTVREIRTASVTNRRVRGSMRPAYVVTGTPRSCASGETLTPGRRIQGHVSPFGRGWRESVTTVPRLDDSDSDGILPVSIGTAAWAVLLAGLLVARSTLDENGTTWWIGAAAVGVVSGVGGVFFLRWRKRRAARRAAA